MNASSLSGSIKSNARATRKPTSATFPATFSKSSRTGSSTTAMNSTNNSNTPATPSSGSPRQSMSAHRLNPTSKSNTPLKSSPRHTTSSGRQRGKRSRPPGSVRPTSSTDPLCRQARAKALRSRPGRGHFASKIIQPNPRQYDRPGNIYFQQTGNLEKIL